MKKNITINLCGRLFPIDEDAYEMLQHYIDSLRQSFGRQDGGEEIVDDIEARIAELFDELRLHGTEAITINHVKDIITRIGQPEQLTDDSGEPSSNNDNGHRYDSLNSAAQDIYNNVRQRTAGKKLFRNPKDKMLAGVLSGFATYTDTNPIIWRLMAVLLFFFYGTGLLLYILLALILPEAKTPEELLQMEGKEVTPQHLADAVIDAKEHTAQPGLLHKLCSLLLKVLFGFFVAIAVLVGIVCGLGFLFALVVLVSALALPVSSDMPFSLQAMGLSTLYDSNPTVFLLFALSLFMLLLIPIYAIIHMVFALAKKVQPMSITQRIVWIVLWVAALCCIVPCSITMVQYSERQLEHEYEELNTTVYQDIEMSHQDADFLRKGKWNLLKADDCDHFTWSGDYYDGNRSVRYLDTYNDACEARLQAERHEAVTPGIYRLSCIARAEGPGACIYAVGDEKHLKAIPACGNRGGNLVSLLQNELAKRDTSASADMQVVSERKTAVKIMGIEFVIRETKTDQNRTSQRAMNEGYGWSVVSIDNIVVTGDTIAYGLSSDEDFTGQQCHSKWFSATDFKLTRMGNLPKNNTKK